MARAAPERLHSAARWPHHLGAWRRSGVYLVADYPRPDHASVHAAFLAAGVLLNPRYREASILPAAASRGELQLLERLFGIRPGA